jgi:preprotein translocase subunit SecE
MASKTAVVNREERGSSIKRQEPGTVGNFTGNVTSGWGRFTSFLGDVRSEIRKVVAPSRKEVQATTTVVIITVFLFGLYFWLTDMVFSTAVRQILHRLAGE